MGETNLQITPPTDPTQTQVSDEEAFLFAMQLAGSATVPMVLKSALELGVLETIAGAGPAAYLSPSNIASRLPITTKNPDAPALLDRLLRLLASYGIFTCTLVPQPHDNNNNPRTETEIRHYGLGPFAKYFVKDEDGFSMVAFLLLQHDKDFKDIWCHLTEAIQEGGIPFDNAHGMTPLEFHSTNPRYNNLFNKAMSAPSSIIMRKILETYTGFEGLQSVVDVGGGTGAVINMIVSKYPTIKGINFDLPHVIKEASSYPGVEHVGGDMFVNIPKADAIFMKWIIHDWDDEQCLEILKNCYDSLPEAGKVILVEFIIPAAPDSGLGTKCAVQMDVAMLAYSSGGKERTQKEYEALAKGAGFQGFRVVGCAFNVHIMEFLKKA